MTTMALKDEDENVVAPNPEDVKNNLVALENNMAVLAPEGEDENATMLAPEDEKNNPAVLPPEEEKNNSAILAPEDEENDYYLGNAERLAIWT